MFVVTAHILVVDDEDTLRHFLRLALEDEGYRVSEAADGQSALSLLARASFDLALVDLRMAGVDGLEVMRQFRQRSPETQIIILTAYASVPSVVEALRHGAHDYLTKPFETGELLASVADGLARGRTQRPVRVRPPQTQLAYGDLVVDYGMRQVTRQGQALDLTPTEFDLLTCLMEAPNVALDSVTVLQQIRGYEATESEARAIVRVHVHRLRQKLEPDPTCPRYVITVAGGRYVFTPPIEQTEDNEQQVRNDGDAVSTPAHGERVPARRLD
jgi:DNA-binding response OmpR family regulator